MGSTAPRDTSRLIPLNDLRRLPEALQRDIRAAVEQVLASGWYVMGPQVASFETEFAAYCGARHCLGVGNGTDALQLALLALGCREGSEVVTVANAGMYASSAIVAVGARPVLADIDPRTMTMAPDALARSITEHTKAVIVTHLYGRLAAIEELTAVAARWRIPLIEDCAQAHGAERGGRRAGTWGTIGCFSFYPTKNLGAVGDGGALITQSEELAEKLRALRQYGWVNKYEAGHARGRNSRLDEVQAAVLRLKLPYLDGWNARRRDIIEAYRAAAGGGVVVPDARGLDSVAHLCVVRSSSRDELAAWLKRNGIATAVHYPVPDHRQAALRGVIGPSPSLPETEAAAAEILTLPCYPGLTEEEVAVVCTSLARFEPRPTR